MAQEPKFLARTPLGLTTARNFLRLSRADLARLLGVAFTEVEAWERGQAPIGPKALKKLEDLVVARTFDTSLDTFFSQYLVPDTNAKISIEGLYNLYRDCVASKDQTPISIIKMIQGIKNAGWIIESSQGNNYLFGHNLNDKQLQLHYMSAGAKIPAPRPAAVAPEWQNGILIAPIKNIADKSASINIALGVVKDELKKLETECAVANIDRRACDFFKRIRKEIPGEGLTSSQLFRALAIGKSS